MLYYIDPGTGSMLFTILVGVMSAGVYKFKGSLLKARFMLSGGRVSANTKEHPAFVIFSDHKRYWNVFEPICDEFEKRGIEIVYMTASPDDPALDKEYEHVKCEFIGQGNKAFARLNTLHADIVISTTPSLDVLYWKRSKFVKYYVHIPHAANDMTMYRMFGLDFYDSILTSADYHEKQIRELEKVRGIPEKELYKAGLIYMDMMKERLDNAPPLSASDRKTVLLAPSWGKSGILSRFGADVIEALLKTDYHIIIRPHPQSYTADKEILESLMEKYPENSRFEWNRDNDNFEVLRRSDILISDFSGVMFDFTLVFDKPLIYTDVQYDPSPYDACWLDEVPWTFRVLPRLGLKLTRDNLDNVGELIEECLSDTRFEQGRREAREETWAYIGEGVARTTDYLLKKHEQLMIDTESEENTETDR